VANDAWEQHSCKAVLESCCQPWPCWRSPPSDEEQYFCLQVLSCDSQHSWGWNWPGNSFMVHHGRACLSLPSHADDMSFSLQQYSLKHICSSAPFIPPGAGTQPGIYGPVSFPGMGVTESRDLPLSSSRDHARLLLSGLNVCQSPTGPGTGALLALDNFALKAQSYTVRKSAQHTRRGSF